MSVNTRFTVAVHILTLIALSQDEPAASEQMALSVGIHPVAVRQAMSSLKKAGLIYTRNGIPGGQLAKPEEQISLYDVYRAVIPERSASLFDFHSRPNPNCPVGRNIRSALEEPLFHAQEAMESALRERSLKDVTTHILHQYAYQIPNEVKT